MAVDATIDLRLACLTIRNAEGELRSLRELSESKTEQRELRDAAEAGRPIWIETRIEGRHAELYEEPLPPWGPYNRPTVSLSGLGGLLDCVAAGPFDRDFLARLLELLPHLEDYGALRLVHEVTTDKSLRKRLIALPLVGFVPLKVEGNRLVQATDETGREPIDTLEPLQCAELRLNLAVVGNVVATVRLPDQPRPKAPPDRPSLQLVEPPTVKIRPAHLPVRAQEIDAIDMATAIMRYFTGTCTAVVRLIQKRLTAVERTLLADDASPGAFDPSAPLHQIHLLGELADHMQRDISRSLRRMPDEPNKPGPRQLLVRRTLLRGRDAVAEVRAAQNELGLAASTTTNLVAARQLRAAETQQQRSVEFQHLVSILGAVVVAPTLIAALWGANTWIPGERAVVGFVSLVMLMAGAAVLTWQLMQSGVLRRSVVDDKTAAPDRTVERSRARGRVAIALATAVCVAAVALLVVAAPETRTDGDGAAATSAGERR